MPLYATGSGGRLRYWAIQQTEECVFFKSGSPGTPGSSAYHLAPTTEAAKRDVEERIREKLEDGYVMVDGAFNFDGPFPGVAQQSAPEAHIWLQRLDRQIVALPSRTLDDIIQLFLRLAGDEVACIGHSWTVEVVPMETLLEVGLWRVIRPFGAADSWDEFVRYGVSARVKISPAEIDKFESYHEISEGGVPILVELIDESGLSDELRSLPVVDWCTNEQGVG